MIAVAMAKSRVTAMDEEVINEIIKTGINVTMITKDQNHEETEDTATADTAVPEIVQINVGTIEEIAIEIEIADVTMEDIAVEIVIETAGEIMIEIAEEKAVETMTIVNQIAVEGKGQKTIDAEKTGKRTDHRTEEVKVESVAGIVHVELIVDKMIGRMKGVREIIEMIDGKTIEGLEMIIQAEIMTVIETLKEKDQVKETHTLTKMSTRELGDKFLILKHTIKT